MGIPIKTSFPVQRPFSTEKMYSGKFQAYFGEKRAFQSSEIVSCICFQVLLDDEYCLDEQGKQLVSESGETFPRLGFIGKFTPSAHEKSNLSKFYFKLFKVKLTSKLWKDLCDGDKLIALVNDQPVKVMFTEPEHVPDSDKYYQNVDKIMGFKPNPKPDISKNPPNMDINNKPIPTDIPEDPEDSVIPF